MKTRTRTGLLAAAAVVGGLVLPTTAVRAGNEGPKNDSAQVAVRAVTFEQSNGFTEGTYINWLEGRTQVKFTLVSDARLGTDPDLGVAEWSLEAYSTSCGASRGAPVDDRPFVNDPTYGPRINDFVSPPFAKAIKSVVVVHDGSTPAADGGAGHTHAIGNPGRHEVACVDVRE